MLEPQCLWQRQLNICEERARPMTETTLNQNIAGDSLSTFASNVLKKRQFFSQEDFLSNLLGHPTLQKFIQRIQYNFVTPELLVRALTHSSFVNEVDSTLRSYERLEFLGDTVLSTVVSKKLTELYPNYTEGELSKARGAVVNEESLSEVARSLNLQALLLLGKGEIKNGGEERDSVLADAVEAILGAIFLDGGYEAAEKVFHNLISDSFFGEERFRGFDPKTRLQEITMKLHGETPEYRSKQIEERLFKVELYIKNQFILKTENSSKKKGEIFLAQNALQRELYQLKGE